MWSLWASLLQAVKDPGLFSPAGSAVCPSPSRSSFMCSPETLSFSRLLTSRTDGNSGLVRSMWCCSNTAAGWTWHTAGSTTHGIRTLYSNEVQTFGPENKLNEFHVCDKWRWRTLQAKRIWSGHLCRSDGHKVWEFHFTHRRLWTRTISRNILLVTVFQHWLV